MMDSHNVFVKVCMHGRSPYWHARWTDPDTGKDKFKSLRTKSRHVADQAAWDLTRRLRAGENIGEIDGWLDAVSLYQKTCSDYIASSKGSKDSMQATINAVCELMGPKSLSQFSERFILEFGKQLRTIPAARGVMRSEATVARHFRSLHVMLQWFYRKKMLASVPHFDMPRAADAKGRAITDDEFQKMLDGVLAGCNNNRVVERSRRYLLRGLWLSGLRLGEAEKLSWDDPTKFRVDLSDPDAPIFVIPGWAQKNRKEKPCPMAPDFAEFLLRTPPEMRVGNVFMPLNDSGDRFIAGQGWCSSWISELGKAANIEVSKEPSRVSGEWLIKYASAHDLRRSFGERWALIVEPNLLMEMMRHSSFETTRKFYLTANARNYSSRVKQLWQQHKAASSTAGA